MRRGAIALTPALITLLAVLAFLAVLNFAITKPDSAGNANVANGNANVSSYVPAPGYENVNEMIVVNANASDDRTLVTNTNTASNTNVSTDPIAGWETYTNNELGFSIKLPPSWDGFTTSQTGSTIYVTHPGTDTVSFAVTRSTETESVGASLVGTRNGYNFFFAASNGAVAPGYEDDWNQISSIRDTFQVLK